MKAHEAQRLARAMLAQDPRRVAHVEGVARCANRIAGQLQGDADLLVAAAWLHDVGYSRRLLSTGFHALDGARFLRGLNSDPRLANLVAHHSCALREAQERGLEQALLGEFPLDESLPHEDLCFCDMTTGPDGQRMDVSDRLAEIRSRYGPEDVVTRFITKAEPEIVATVRQVERRLAAQSR